ncbi:recombinase family protein [Streptacidiphilus sp. MAP5-3]|uniref:recombinase family protein n=1 Tax=unclassified Streptacidiphilus TaxID=2643834 RepID=UPI00351348DF
MLIGYARVSTADQNPDHQIDALLQHGVDCSDIHVGTASGAKASRPKLEAPGADTPPPPTRSPGSWTPQRVTDS